MAKQLIGAANVADHICMESKTIHIDQTMILSPGAKDVLRNQGISINYGPRPVAVTPAAATVAPALAGQATLPVDRPCIRGDERDCPLVAECAAGGSGHLCRTMAEAEAILAKKYDITDAARRQAVLVAITKQLTTGVTA